MLYTKETQRSKVIINSLKSKVLYISNRKEQLCSFVEAGSCYEAQANLVLSMQCSWPHTFSNPLASA